MENQTELKWYQKPTGIIILLIFFFPVGLYLMWKNELWTKQTRWIVTAVIVLILVANANNDKNSNSSNSNNSYNNSASEEVSKKAYRAGYNDGQLNFGDPSAPSYQYFLGNHPEISGADVYVYKMGYEDAVLGKSSQY